MLCPPCPECSQLQLGVNSVPVATKDREQGLGLLEQQGPEGTGGFVSFLLELG